MKFGTGNLLRNPGGRLVRSPQKLKYNVKFIPLRLWNHIWHLIWSG